MTETLFDLTLELARRIAPFVDSVSTASGSSTTLIDSVRTEPNDHFNGGVIFIRSGTYQGYTSVITDYNSTTHAFTFSPALGGTIASGVYYTAVPKDFPRGQLRWAINEALQSIGARSRIPLVDSTLTTVEEQEEYDLPSGVYNVKRVEVATRTSAPYKFQKNYNWEETAEGKIRFDPGFEPMVDDYIIRLTHCGDVDELVDDDDECSLYLHKDLVVWEAIVHLLRWRYQQTEGNEKHRAQLLNDAVMQADVMKRIHPVQVMARDPHLAAAF